MQHRGFDDRADAGRQLAAALTEYTNRDDVLVLALPRGGVPVAYEVARTLNAPLDVFTVRKLGVPGQEELALGAIASGGVQVLNQNVVATFDLDETTIERIARREQAELERREQAYRDDRPPLDIKNRTVILVDDGLATGATMWAAVYALRQMDSNRIVLAIPVAPPSTIQAFEDMVDDLVCLITPEMFEGVGRWYQDFRQTTDYEVKELLSSAVRSEAQ